MGHSREFRKIRSIERVGASRVGICRRNTRSRCFFRLRGKEGVNGARLWLELGANALLAYCECRLELLLILLQNMFLASFWSHEEGVRGRSRDVGVGIEGDR